MNRPPLEVADIVRCAGQSFIERSRKWITGQHEKVLLAITRCRTAALGGHRDQCSDCGHTAISYNSCRNRHCPRCQGNARQRWLQARERELLPASYVHVVFTLPRELAPLALQNKRLIYNLLFHASAQLCWRSLAIPVTWVRRLVSSACSILGTSDCNIIPMSTAWWPPAVSLRITPAGSPRAAPSSFPSKCSAVSSAASLSPDSRPPFIPAHSSSTDISYRLRNRAPSPRGCGYCSVTTGSSTAKRPFGGPEHVLRYLGAYTHRVAISNSRLVALSEGNVTFRWRDSAHGNKKRLMTLPVDEFLRRFLLHLLPRGFMRIRNFGFLANRRRAEFLPLCFRLLQPSDQPAADATSPPRCPFTRCGNVRFAAEPCRLSSASPPRNSSSDLRLISAGAPHESTSPASNLARASARTLRSVSRIPQNAVWCALRLSDAPPHAPFSL